MIVALLCAAGLFAKDGDRILAMGYLGFRDDAATKDNYLKLAEAGLDLVTLEMDQSGAGHQLDLAAEAGVKILAVLAPYTDHHNIDYVDFASVDSLVLGFKDHPALFGWHICDEPNLNRIPDLKYIKEHIEALDPAHPVYINLDPLGSMRALGTDFYADYVERYAAECNLQLLSYDCYPAMAYGLLNWWYMCNEAVLATCLAHNIPFWAFAATCWIDRESPHNMHEKPSLENVRLQINTNLAYGAQVMQYFTIRDFGGTSWAPIMGDGRWTDAYDVLKAANLEMKCRQDIFAGCNVVKTRFTGPTPFACRPLVAADLPEAIASLESDRTALVSFIENGDARYVAIVNSTHKSKTAVLASFTAPVSIISRTGAVSECPAGKNALVIDEGDMLVIRYK